MISESNLLAIRCQLEAAITEREGMIAENKQREQLGQSMAYTEDAFHKLYMQIEEIRVSIG